MMCQWCDEETGSDYHLCALCDEEARTDELRYEDYD